MGLKFLDSTSRKLVRIDVLLSSAFRGQFNGEYREHLEVALI
jgi:hypothetical protein